MPVLSASRANKPSLHKARPDAAMMTPGQSLLSCQLRLQLASLLQSPEQPAQYVSHWTKTWHPTAPGCLYGHILGWCLTPIEILSQGQPPSVEALPIFLWRNA